MNPPHGPALMSGSVDHVAMPESVSAEQHRDYRLFFALDDDGDGWVAKKDFAQLLQNSGLICDDPRLKDFFLALEAEKEEILDFDAFLRLQSTAGLLVEHAFRGDLIVPDFANFKVQLEKLFVAVEDNTSGTQASYIPPLQEVDPDQFGMGLVTVDGQVLALGSADVDFSIQSACKPFNYCFALEEVGEHTLHQHIGTEPSGQAFNARSLLQDGTHRPHNPLINSGAIMAAALIRNDLPVHRRLQHVRGEWAKLVGGSQPRFNAWMAQEEGRTGDNNRALAYMMKAAGVLPKGTEAVDHEVRDALDLYFSTCSLEMTSRELACAAATLANGGVNPLTQERVLRRTTVRHCLSIMQMCGMYDGSGEFCFRIGLPAKSGVGGAVILVVPGLMGICMWSPRLDAVGNSVRGVEMATRLVERYCLHLYDGVTSTRDRVDPRVPAARSRAMLTSEVLEAASRGDLMRLKRLGDENAELQNGDYDKRSPLHLAAAGGHENVVQFLLEHGVDPNLSDRWGGTPLDDALLSDSEETQELLKQAGGLPGTSAHTSSEGDTDPNVLDEDPTVVAEFVWAAAQGDMYGLRRLTAQGILMNVADYDGRTALHLAACEDQIQAVRYLLAHGHPVHVRDRWGATPLDEALREEHSEIAALLSEAV